MAVRRAHKAVIHSCSEHFSSIAVTVVLRHVGMCWITTMKRRGGELVLWLRLQMSEKATTAYVY